ncbi:complement C1q-like protein 4 [Esox lucius]|uniref:C1q domain-containing protein n=1 Tax=Esox lucius TaxID=8010 RepID=A0A3P8ZR44_ESOLU|nr:complement C1q-like protein 4 [Esox lucius]
MQSCAVSPLCLWGLLFLCTSVKAQSAFDLMRDAAVAWSGALPCGNWDCDCVFKHQRGCCCVANQMSALEDNTFTRMVDIWEQLSQFNNGVLEVTGNNKIAFTAAMRARSDCLGPYTSNMPISYSSISLNQGNGYSPTLGTFTAPRAGLYSFSVTVYSNVGIDGARLYHNVQLMRNDEVLASVWEDNREDQEDSATQTLLVSLRQGNQVYVQLVSGRSLCGNAQELNRFSGYLVYPLTDA